MIYTFLLFLFELGAFFYLIKPMIKNITGWKSSVISVLGFFTTLIYFLVAYLLIYASECAYYGAFFHRTDFTFLWAFAILLTGGVILTAWYLATYHYGDDKYVKFMPWLNWACFLLVPYGGLCLSAFCYLYIGGV